MADVTAKGRELYLRVQRRLAPDHDFYEALGTCSLLARHATTYSRIQEIWCSDEMPERQVKASERREALLELRLTALATRLPTPNGPMQIEFQGDPRGWTVKLFVLGDDPDQGNCYGVG